MTSVAQGIKPFHKYTGRYCTVVVLCPQLRSAHVNLLTVGRGFKSLGGREGLWQKRRLLVAFTK